MNYFKNLPKVLAQKILFTVLIGVGCFIIGLSYFLFSHDRIFLFLSCVILLCSIYRGYNIYIVISKKKYEVIEGTCVSVTTKIIGKFKKVKLMDNNGVETTLNLSKNCKLIIGEKYKFYFTKQNQFYTGNNRIDTSLATDNFLGYEAIISSDDDIETKKMQKHQNNI